MDTLDPTQIANLRALGDDILAEIVQVFLDSSPTQLSGVAEGLDSGDLGKVRYHAHSLKGASANVGAVGVHAAAKALEFAAKDGDEAAAQQLRSGLDAAYAEAVIALRSLT
jgi:HPt (histidine-containing phosphotransfer) domain-containing protein